MKRILVITLLAIILLLIITWYGLNYIAPYGIIKMDRKSKQELNKLLNHKISPENYNLKFKTLEIITTDSVKLQSWYINSRTLTDKVIILLHGVNASKEYLLDFANELAENYNVFLFDSRGHGESGGMYCTYGYYEKYDVLEIIKEIKKDTSIHHIGLYGNSMGAAIGLQVMSISKDIDCGYFESPFANFREIVRDYMERVFFVGPMFMSNIALNKAGEIAKFQPDKIRPELSAKFIEKPIILIHGKEDKHINYSYSVRIFKNIKSQEKRLILLDSTNHFNIHIIGGNSYKKSIFRFFETYLK
jgi:hypothetical protein